MDLTPGDLVLSRVTTPRTTLCCPSPRRASLLVPLPPRFKCFPATKIFAHLLSSVVFFCLVYCIELYWVQKLLLIKEFIKLELIKNILTCLLIDLSKVQDCCELWNFEILINIVIDITSSALKRSKSLAVKMSKNVSCFILSLYPWGSHLQGSKKDYEPTEICEAKILLLCKTDLTQI